MGRRLGLAAVWLLATVAATGVAWGAVRLAGEQVGDRPVNALSSDQVEDVLAGSIPPSPDGASVDPAPRPGAGAEPTATSRSGRSSGGAFDPSTGPGGAPVTSAPTDAISPSTTRVSSRPATAPPTTPPPTTGPPTTPPPTTLPPGGSATTTSAPTPASPSSTSAPPTTSPDRLTKVYRMQGGSVGIEYWPDNVVLQWATPEPGFSVEVKDRGPDQVEVEFEGEDDEEGSEFEATWRNGQLEVSIEGD